MKSSDWRSSSPSTSVDFHPVDFNETFLREIPLIDSSGGGLKEESHLTPFLWISGIVLLSCFTPLIWKKSAPYRLKILTLLKSWCKIK